MSIEKSDGLSAPDFTPETIATTRVLMDLPDQTLIDLEFLANQKDITRTKAIEQSVATTKRLVEMAPHGARVEPLRLWDRIFIRLFD